MLSTLLVVAAAILGFAVLAGAIALVARQMGLFKDEGTTVQIKAIPENAVLPTVSDQTGHAMDPPRLRETAVAAWASRVVPLHAPVIAIGRAITNNLVLPDDPVSAQHCRIERVGKTFRLIDLGSRNRTWVNGDPVEDAILRHGDQIRIGRSTFIFEDEVPT